MSFLAILFTLIAATPAIAPAAAHEYRLGSLHIAHPWSRETAAKAPVGAGFLVITNTGRTMDRLIAVKTAIADNAEIHTMTMDGGVMRMRELKGGLTIPAGERVALQPGAEHIMFMGLKGPIVLGADVKATLVFEIAGEVEVTFKVEPRAAAAQPLHAH
jgi:copper(I)-binding protein